MINHLLVVDPRKRLSAQQALRHPWMLDRTIAGDTDLSRNLSKMREWNAARKMKASGLVVKSCIKFSLTGQRYRRTFLDAAARAKELESKGIHWFQSPEAIQSQEQQLFVRQSVSTQ